MGKYEFPFKLYDVIHNMYIYIYIYIHTHTYIYIYNPFSCSRVVSCHGLLHMGFPLAYLLWKEKIYSNQCFIWPLLLGWPSKYLSPLCSNHVNLRNRSSTSVPVLTGMTCLRKAGEIDIILAKKSLDRHLQGNQIHPDSRTT